MSSQIVSSRLCVKEYLALDGAAVKVYCLGHYYPTRWRQAATCPDSRALLELKSAFVHGIDYYHRLLEEILPGPGVQFVAMPSHGTGAAASSGGLRQLISRVEGAIDLSDTLVRRYAVRKSAGAWPGSRPDEAQHFDSLAIQSQSRLRGKSILLLDDVVTRGVSMCAARRRLLLGGAQSVVCVALTRTMSGYSH